MNNEEFSEHIEEILRRVRSGEEQVYSMEEVRFMLGISEPGIIHGPVKQITYPDNEIDLLDNDDHS